MICEREVKYMMKEHYIARYCVSISELMDSNPVQTADIAAMIVKNVCFLQDLN